MKLPSLKWLILPLLTLFFSVSGNSQENIRYQTPPAEIMELADYERTPSVMLDSRNEYMIFTYRSTYKSLDELNQPELKLAGLRINPVVNISSTTTYFNNIKIRKATEPSEIQVSALPDNPKITNLQFPFK